MTGVVSAVVEAWDELRIHKLRVLLALVGVAVAVCAITGITGAAQMMTQVFKEQGERDGGRDLTLQVNMWSQGPEPTTGAAAAYTAAFRDLVRRHHVEYASLRAYTMVPVRLPSGTADVDTELVEPDYGVIHRVQPTEGRWFADADAGAFAPTLVVNEAFMAAIGSPAVADHPTVLLGRDDPVRATVVGVVEDRWEMEMPRTYVLYDHAERWALTPDAEYLQPSLEVWVPPGTQEEVTTAFQRDLSASVPGAMVDIWPSSQSFNALEGGTRWVITGIGAFTLLLGGLGLLNISLVTVRHRIREIGIRRSFGATSARVFLGVLMESVVATVVAGLAGVVVAVAIITNIPLDRVFGYQLQEVPPFPVQAALVGMVCATAVGALAGLVPALVAVRVKVIDAIRY